MSATFKQPDQTVDSAPEYKANIDASINVLAEIANNFSPNEANPLSMGITINSGKLWNGVAHILIATTNTVLFAAPSSLPRIDRLAINIKDGGIFLISGSENASPVAPQYGPDQYPICQILFSVGQTTIVNADITDERPLINIMPTVFNNTTGTAPPTVNHDISTGYSVSSIWIDLTNDEAYRCLDSTIGAAIWVNTTMDSADVAAIYAPLISPALTGVPTAPTAANGTNTTQIATTAFVLNNPPSIPANSITQTEMAGNSIGAPEIIDGSVGQAEIGANAVGQSELKTTSGTVSVSGSSATVGRVTLSGGAYGFYPRTYVSGGFGSATIGNNFSNTGTNANITLTSDSGNSGNTYTTYANQYYVQASPPYNLGDGDIPLFVFATIDNLTGLIESLYVAPEAPWHYNGSTDIRATRKDVKSGRSWRKTDRITFEKLNGTITNGLMKDSNFTLQQKMDILADKKSYEVEITQAIKQRDMVDIPHPFLGNDLTGKTIIMLDPVSKVVQNLYDLHDAGENVNELLHDGFINFGNTQIKRITPNECICVDVKWRNTL